MKYKEITSILKDIGRRHEIHHVFSDWLEMFAIAISNHADVGNEDADGREDHYLRTANKYDAKELEKFCKASAELMLYLDRGYSDVLGGVFHEMELHNKWIGQFFSPYSICKMMAAITLGDDEHLVEKIKNSGYVTVCEPSCGSGAIIIAMAEEIQELGFSPSKHMHATAIDIDQRCVHMAYIQFSLLNLPATVIHGNALSLETRSTWRTPASFKFKQDWPLFSEQQAA